MEAAIIIILAIVVLLIGGALWWRRASRLRSLPCPTWFAWFLESSFWANIRRMPPSLDRLDLGPGMRVIDVGCGPGRLTIPVARAVEPNGEALALDIQEGMLERLQKRTDAAGLKNVRPILGGIGEVEIESDSFDRALLVTVLGEIPDREAALREIYRVLKPGGILSITEIFPDPHYQTGATVRGLCQAAGFRLAKEFGHVLAFTMNFVKPNSQ
jgi:ubiquinone/menaquinone biosynthesis C-methylase UbiE